MNTQKLMIALLFAGMSAATHARCPFREMKEAHNEMMAEFEKEFSCFMENAESTCSAQNEKGSVQKLACPTTEIREEKEHIVVKCFLGENVGAAETKDLEATMDEQGIEVKVPSLGKTVHVSTDKWDGVTFFTVKVIEERSEKNGEHQQKFFNRSRQRIMVASSLDLENPTIDVEKGNLAIVVPKKMSKKVNFTLKKEMQNTKE